MYGGAAFSVEFKTAASSRPRAVSICDSSRGDARPKYNLNSKRFTCPKYSTPTNDVLHHLCCHHVNEVKTRTTIDDLFEQLTNMAYDDDVSNRALYSASSTTRRLTSRDPKYTAWAIIFAKTLEDTGRSTDFVDEREKDRTYYAGWAPAFQPAEPSTQYSFRQGYHQGNPSELDEGSSYPLLTYSP